MRILLVEDDDMIGESVVAGLECEGHAIDWVRDGNSALLALNTTPFSLVILDLGLPGKDGLQVLKEMRKMGGKRAKMASSSWKGRKTDETGIQSVSAGRGVHPGR